MRILTVLELENPGDFIVHLGWYLRGDLIIYHLLLTLMVEIIP